MITISSSPVPVVDSPRALAAFLQSSRSFWAKIGWNVSAISIGWNGDTVRMTDGGGAIDYQFNGNRIIRTSHPGYGKVVEFVDMDAARPIAALA